MTNIGYHQCTFHWIIICSIGLLFNFTSIIQANQMECNIPYNLEIQDEQKTFNQFYNMAASDSVKTIFFQMHIRNQHFVANDSTYYFAWIKNDFGKAIFTLPTLFMLMSLGLYSTFVGGINITLIDPTQDCYQNANFFGREQIIFETLINFTRLHVNHTCSVNYCPTVCLRHFAYNDGNFGKNIKVNCCQKDTLNPQVNITSCLTNREKPSFHV